MKKGTDFEALSPSLDISGLENYAVRLRKLIGNKRIALTKEIDGSLRVNRNHGSVQFYHVTKETGKNGRYIPKNNVKLIKQVAQKDYDKRILRRMIKLEQVLKRFCADYKKLLPEDTFDRMLDERKPFVEPIILPGEQYARLWKSVEYHKKVFWEGSAEYFTASGLRVRSKSEILIADMLERYGIPFRYEFPVELRRFGTVHPDFYVLRVADRKEFCWEHFGMMDVPEYAQKAVRKIAAYAESGWFPGENMIVSFEAMDCPLEEKQIERLVEGLLL